VLIANALAASGVLCCYGLFSATSPAWLIVLVLLASGLLRSLQFTSLNAVVYAEVGQERMGQASSIASMVQQLSTAVGVTVGSYALGVASAATGEPMTAAINFGFAFLTVGVISASSVLVLRRLAPDAGAEMAGRAQAGKEVLDPMPVQRPGT
jgi:MFS family permease